MEQNKQLTMSYKYNIGMFGTCADPLHLGHVNLILRGAAECRRFYIVLCYNKAGNGIPYKTRHQWLFELTRHLPHVQILDLEDDAPTKADYTREHWAAGAAEIRQRIGAPIDVIYCGSDYTPQHNPYRDFYPEAEICCIPREQLPISSTQIRTDPLRYWDYLAQPARPYFVKRVLVIGHESTGKSTLVQNLAHLYNTTSVAEYGRDMCERCGGAQYLTPQDYEEIIHRHKLNILRAQRHANKLLFIDTDALITYWFSCFEEERSPMFADTAEQKMQLRHIAGDYDLVLFLEANVPFVDDGLRYQHNNTNDLRIKLSDRLKALYTECGYRLTTISAPDFATRQRLAMQHIDALLPTSPTHLS